MAAVQVADLIVRHAKIGDSGNRKEVSEESWAECSGWKMLFNHQTDEERVITRASLKRALERVPTILEGIV